MGLIFLQMLFVKLLNSLAGHVSQVSSLFCVCMLVYFGVSPICGSAMAQLIRINPA